MTLTKRAGIATAGLTALLSAALTGCGSTTTGPTTDGTTTTIPTAQGLNLIVERDDALRSLFPESVIDSGKLRLALDPSYPPSAFKDADGQIVGVGPDLAQVVAAKAGLTVEWTEVPFDGMLGGLGAQRFDAAWAGFSVTPARLEVINMVTYIKGGSAVLTASGNPEGIEQLDDLCGVVVAVQKGTIQAQDVMTEIQNNCTSKKLAPAEPLELPLQTDVVQAVDVGRAVAALGDGVNISYLALQESDRFEIAEGILILPVDAAIAVPLQQTETAEALSSTFNAIIEDGTYAEVMDSWNLQSVSVPESVVNPGAR